MCIPFLIIYYLPPLKLSFKTKNFHRLDLYYETSNKLCKRNGDDREFSELSAATQACSNDENCVGFFDSCGAGTRYVPCKQPLRSIDSSCGDKLYLSSGNYAFYAKSDMG